MARLTTGQKAQRVIRFLYGVRRPRIAAALAMYGFTQETLDEGWTLLRCLAGEKLSIPGPPARPDPALLDRLDAWENKWLLVAEVTLRRHHPEVAGEVFLNLSRTSGPEVTVSVTTFLARFKALAAGSEDEQAAYALLIKRGLTDEVVGRAQELLDAIGAVQELPETPIDEEKIVAAEEAMWGWYREWSSIARIAIQDGRLLRSLGFGARRRSDAGTVEDSDEADDHAAELQPAPAAPLAPPA